MSYSHTQRRKTIGRFKTKYGEHPWYKKFREYVAELVKERQGTPMGSLEDLIK
jgi:hypothetical protein